MKKTIRSLLPAVALACMLAAEVNGQVAGEAVDSYELFYQPFRQLASADSQYLAQDATELRTYEELGLQFQYIESAAIRRQLKLPEEQGLLVLAVDTDKAGHNAGFVEGDLILMADMTPIDTQYDFVIDVNGKRGQECSVEILRDGEPHSLKIQLDPIDSGALEAEGRWIIGVHVDQASEALQAQLLSTGAVITSLPENAPAISGGLKVHDVIARINGIQIATPEDLRRVVGESGGEPVRLEYYRGGKLMSLDLTPVREQAEEKAGYELRFAPKVVELPVLHWHLTKAMESSEEDRLAQILERVEQLGRDVQELKERIK
jgi:S1-C subfamily serine protease